MKQKYLYLFFISAPRFRGYKSRSLSLFILTFSFILWGAQPVFAKSAKEPAKKESELNAYDPFADYSEFENTAEEQKNIHFFQHGRFITLGILGGVRLFTMNMANFYRIGPAYGGYLNYFFDMNFAIQFAVTASTHYIAFNTGGTPQTGGVVQAGNTFIGSADFFSMGIDFKYFLDKNLFNKNFNWLAPYFFVGVLRSSLIMTATLSQKGVFFDDSGYGVNVGLGLEFHFMRRIHLGVQYGFQFVTLEKEYLPLGLNSGNSTSSLNFRPYGDWMNVAMILGVNF